MPTEPLPEIGESTVKGVVSFGIPKKFVTGESKEQIVSKAPEALSIFMARNKATRVGVMFRTILNPSLAPLMNSENISTPLKIP